MASFYDTTVGQQVEFQRVLASAGFTDSDVVRIIKQPNLAATMYASIQPQTLNPTDIVARVERQLARYEEVGGIPTDWQRQRILAQAAAFVPLSVSDRPLVTGFFGNMSAAFNQVWSLVELDGYTTERHFEQGVSLRFALGMKPGLTEPRLVHFDPNSYQGLVPEVALEQARKDNIPLAGIEVAEMLFVEPKWALEWNGTNHPYPNCSGLQFGSDWSLVPCVNRWDDGRQLVLDVGWAGIASGRSASPSVREC